MGTLQTSVVDVTNGPFPSKICPARTLTAALELSKIADIDPFKYYISSKHQLASKNNRFEINGITKDISSGIMYIVTSRSGYANQILCKACDSNITPIKSITSSSPVNLVCLTSGPRGLFAIDLNSFSFGRLDDKTGEFKRMNYLPGTAISYTSVGAISHTSSVGVNARFERRKKKKRTGGDNRRNIVDPYSNVGLVFAQDSHGVLHYIDKDGIHYKTKKKTK